MFVQLVHAMLMPCSQLYAMQLLSCRVLVVDVASMHASAASTGAAGS